MVFFFAPARVHLFTFILLARETHLDGREGGDDGGRAEAVRDEAEVGEVPLNRGVEYLRGPRVAQRRAVLVQQVHQLFRNYSAKRRKTLMNHESRTDTDQKFLPGFPPVRATRAAITRCQIGPSYPFTFGSVNRPLGRAVLSRPRHLALRSDESTQYQDKVS